MSKGSFAVILLDFQSEICSDVFPIKEICSKMHKNQSEGALGCYT